MNFYPMRKRLSIDALSYPLICLSCLLVYTPVVFLDFQRAWDDGWMVMNHYTVMGFTWDNLRAVFTDFYAAQYGPINEVIYMAIYATFGYNPVVYHLYPLLLHLVNACLVLLFVQQLIEEYIDKVTARRIAFATALLFAIHPLQVESIAWISASKIPLYTFFALLFLLTYIRYARTGKIGFYLGSFLLFVCSFGSKEQSVILPLLLPLIDWVLNRTPFACGENPVKNKVTKQSWVYLFLEKAPFVLFSLFAGLYTYTNQSASIIERWAGYPIGQRMVFAGYSLVEYLGHLVFPIKLLYLYPFPMAPGKEMPAGLFIYPVITVAAAIVLMKILKRQNWPVIFGILFFLINMALMLHLIAMSRFSIMADRYVYLPSVGIFFIAAWYAVPWLQKVVANGKNWIFVLVACYLLYLGGYAHFRTYVWKDDKTLKKEFKELIDVDLLKQSLHDL